MALSKKDLQAIATLFDEKFDENFKPIDQRITNIENDVAQIKETVNKNYGMLEEFYVYQKEHNTQTSDTLGVIEGELEMHNNQISLNTAKLKQVHIPT